MYKYLGIKWEKLKNYFIYQLLFDIIKSKEIMYSIKDNGKFEYT